jgi:hypothetical protein
MAMSYDNCTAEIAGSGSESHSLEVVSVTVQAAEERCQKQAQH